MSERIWWCKEPLDTHAERGRRPMRAYRIMDEARALRWFELNQSGDETKCPTCLDGGEGCGWRIMFDPEDMWATRAVGPQGDAVYYMVPKP